MPERSVEYVPVVRTVKRVEYVPVERVRVVGVVGEGGKGVGVKERGEMIMNEENDHKVGERLSI